jgi:hypothetical protein
MVEPMRLRVILVAEYTVFILRESLFVLDPVSPMPTFVHDQTNLSGAPLVRRETELKNLRREA